jgi:hypothetical protein
VTNTGSATDRFSLVVGGNVWTTTAASMTVGPLIAGATGNVLVTVNIPTSVVPGAIDTVTITATSQGLDTASAAVTLTTTAIPYRIFLPVIIKGSAQLPSSRKPSVRS